MSVVQTAIQYIGLPYIWGGTSPTSGFDCSGLTQFAYKQNGIEIPRTAQAQYNKSNKIEAGDLQPGDLIFFGSSTNSIDHVVIYAGDNSAIEAPHTGANVQISKNIFNRKNIVGYGSYNGGSSDSINPGMTSEDTKANGTLHNIASKVDQIIIVLLLVIGAAFFFTQAFEIKII